MVLNHAAPGAEVVDGYAPLGLSAHGHLFPVVAQGSSAAEDVGVFPDVMQAVPPRSNDADMVIIMGRFASWQLRPVLLFSSAPFFCSRPRGALLGARSIVDENEMENTSDRVVAGDPVPVR